MICIPRNLSGIAARTMTLALGSTLVFSGCGGTSPSDGSGSPAPAAVTQGDHGHEHAHPTEGPHHGSLVELGSEEYHAEVVHAENGEVTIYVLDSTASKPVPIDATEVTINVTHQGEGEQFKIPAAPDAGDAAGKSSRFALKDEHLAEDLDAEGTVAKLVLTINGTQYTGRIEHSHDHGSHDHDGHDHSHKDHPPE